MINTLFAYSVGMSLVQLKLGAQSAMIGLEMLCRITLGIENL